MDSHDIGIKGEDIACRFLEKKGYRILERNFKVKSGEIDIIAQKEKGLYFVEVKTTARQRVGGEVHQRPEENVTPSKMKKLSRAIQTYLEKRKEKYESEWEFLVIAINLNLEEKKAFVKMIIEPLVER